MIRFSIRLGTVTLIALCGFLLPAQAEDDSKVVHYFPTKVGDKWTYVYSDPTGKNKDVEVDEEITQVEKKDGAMIVTISRRHTDGKFYPDRKREVSDKGIIQTEQFLFGNVSPLQSPWVHLKLPSKAGQSWPSRRMTTYVERPAETIKVPAGEVKAIRIDEYKNDNLEGPPIQTTWYAPRMGIVKVGTPNVVISLKSFSEGK
jgi:hypothetical protein